MNFFGSVDKKPGPDGQKKVASMYPAWYFTQHVDQMEDALNSRKNRLRSGVVPPETIPYEKGEIEKEEIRLRDIKESRPHVGDGERDRLHKAYKEIGKEISDSLFTRFDTEKGFADAHEEARRMSKPIIKVRGDVLEFAKATGSKVTDGMVTRNDATRMFKIVGKLLGEPTHIEVLRKDKHTIRKKKVA